MGQKSCCPVLDGNSKIHAECESAERGRCSLRPLSSVVLQINCERPNKADIEKAIRHMKRGKVPAQTKQTSTEILHDLFGKIWEQEEISTEWKEGYLVKLPKKGGMQERNNYRGIMLLSVHGKVLNRVILDRLKTGADAKLRDHQAGFRKD